MEIDPLFEHLIAAPGSSSPQQPGFVLQCFEGYRNPNAKTYAGLPNLDVDYSNCSIVWANVAFCRKLNFILDMCKSLIITYLKKVTTVNQCYADIPRVACGYPTFPGLEQMQGGLAERQTTTSIGFCSFILNSLSPFILLSLPCRSAASLCFCAVTQIGQDAAAVVEMKPDFMKGTALHGFSLAVRVQV